MPSFYTNVSVAEIAQELEGDYGTTLDLLREIAIRQQNTDALASEAAPVHISTLVPWLRGLATKLEAL
jgi:hypothetical protein